MDLLQEDLHLSSDSEDEAGPVSSVGEVSINKFEMKENTLKKVTYKTRNKLCVAKNAPFPSQAVTFSREVAAPRRLQEVVARISTRDRPEGECKNHKLKKLISVRK